MTYRWQEIIKILIPGFYLLLGVGISYLIDHNAYNKEVVEVISKSYQQYFLFCCSLLHLL